ncbi:hypothetical protein HOB10_00125 [Candidatus Parcubacteria bacterium]|jgi:hypothetical protein|nr:hypothetical protein [Candidatus Parcubacteria bacterium]
MEPREIVLISKEKKIQLTIFIPRLERLNDEQNNDLAWRFMRKFSEDFAELRKMYPNVVRPVDGYVNHTEGWDIIVTVPESHLEPLYTMIDAFCTDEEISFNKPVNED